MSLSGGEPLDVGSVTSVLLSLGACDPCSAGALLALLSSRGVPDPQLLLGLSEGFLGLAEHVALPPLQPGVVMVDVVGTGGDGRDAFNVSTAAGFVCAAAGLAVAKHGNRSSAAGGCGSADLVAALAPGALDLPGSVVASSLASAGFCFLFAPSIHTALKAVRPLRAALPFKTVFNLLGPLMNPLRPPVQVTGVGSPDLGPVFAAALASRGQTGMVIHSEDGLDEFSVAAGTWVWEVRGGAVRDRVLVLPADLGLGTHALDAVVGGSAAERAARLRRLLAPGGADADPALRDFVAANSAAPLYLAGKAASLREGASLALALLRGGQALASLEAYTAAVAELAGGAGQQQPTFLDKILATVDRQAPTAAPPLPAPLPPLDLARALASSASAGSKVIAEFKRASPSKGVINAGRDPVVAALEYARGGAVAVSVLTEPHFFQGGLQDMLRVRTALTAAYGARGDRPLVLRKDFLLHERHVREAREHGADTVLLIVAAMDGERELWSRAAGAAREPSDDLLARRSAEQLGRLIVASRELGMEPLVEINTDRELDIVLATTPLAKVVGVNNRNLRTFEVDMATTARLSASCLARAPGMLVLALSGIASRQDVTQYRGLADGALIGEHLMRSADAAAEVARLRGTGRPVVKICGVKTPEMALACARAGADLVGVVFAAGSSRLVTVEQAKAIAAALHGLRRPTTTAVAGRLLARDWSKLPMESRAEAVREAAAVRPLLVGVFSGQPPAEVAAIAEAAGLDLVQLCGDHDDPLAPCPVPVIRAMGVKPETTTEELTGRLQALSAAPNVLLALVDSARGGSGQAFDWTKLPAPGTVPPFLLAGGLTPQSVSAACAQVTPWGVDVSSGVETQGAKDPEKISLFCRAVL
jgi:anthranilate synthase/indole-3-glycerol phosphate synthase/phosphoribosylanthranilate isomerase